MGAITFWKQFKTVLWKNAVVKRRNAGTLLLELIIPVAVMLALWAIRSAIKFSTISASVPKDYMWNSDLDQLYTNPPCTSENLLWSCVQSGSNCITASTTPGDYPGCLIRRIGVAPRKEDEIDVVDVAQNFVGWANRTYASAHNASLFVYFNSERHFLDYIGQNGYSLKDDIPVFSSAIIFDSGYPNWEYTIRTNKTYSVGSDYYSTPQTRIDPINNLIKTNDEAPTDDSNDDMQPYLEAYNTLGFFALSETVNSYIATITCQETGNCGTNENVGVRVLGAANFPHEERKADQFWASLGSVFALLMIIALLYPLSNAIKTLVTEKETKLREQMLMMALRSDVLWLSWIIHFLALYIPLSVALMLASGSLFRYSDQVYVFLYFMAFFVSSLSYCVLISVIISKAKTAAIVGSVLFFAGYFIFVGLQSANPSRSQLLLACLHPASAFTYGTLAFQEYEDAEIGVTRYTWDVSAKYNISFQDTLMMQFVDTLYIGFLAFYLSHVWPSEYGSSKPWYFLLQYDYWFHNCNAHNSKQRVTNSSLSPNPATSAKDHIEMSEMHSIIVEDVTEDLMGQAALNKCVQIKNLRKSFATPTGDKIAVDDLNLTFYSGQITALLGHNGAGKSTTVSMLTGLITPDSGTAIIEGHDIAVDMQEARKSLGVCPQHDVLIPDMTVEEHLAFFARVKGCNSDDLDSEVTKMIESVGLVEKRREYAHNLSGGQKRKLSVAIAFIGNSRVVFLDEPTSGMDPYSRRFTWNVIRQHREGRVIVLTTHFMDEADLLGDRIAIMGDGKLRCVGSSLFLKTKYGVGYNMTIEKRSPLTFNTKAVIAIINQHVADAKTLTNVGTELTVQLPLTSSHCFQTLFEQFDANSESLGIQSYGMSVTTLEEVFIKVAEGNVIRPEDVSNRAQMNLDEQHLTVAKKSVNSHDLVGEILDEEHQSHKLVEFEKIDENSYLQIFLVHMEAMLHKRALYFMRDSKSWTLQYLLPVIFVLAGMAVMYFAVFTRDQPSITLTIDDYNKGIGSNQLPFPFSAGRYVCPSSDNGDCSDWKVDISGQEIIMQEMVKVSNLPLEPGEDFISVYNMSFYLQHNRNDFEASRYSAVTFASIGNRDENVNNSTILNLEYIIHANFTGVHAGPLTATLIADALLRTYHQEASIVVNLHPLPETRFEKQRFRNFNLSNLVFFILLAIPYIPAAFGSFILREKECKAKHQQLVSGVSVISYWFATWIWDNLTYQVTAWMIIILIVVFPDTESLSQGYPLGVTIGLFMLFGTAITGFTYLFCLQFKHAAGAQTAIISVIFVLGLLLEIAGIILRIIPSTRDMYLNHLRIVFSLSPAFALGDALNAMAVIDFLSAAELGGSRKYSPLDWDIAGLCITMLAIESVAYIMLFISIEYLMAIPSIQLYFSRHISKQLPCDIPNSDKDEDVVMEEERVESGKADDSTILISRLKKMYSGGKYAVRGVSLGIPNGECFGLLGINGAGKTTLLSILSGEFPPTLGEVSLTGMNLFTEIHKCRRKIGYCPQFDALFDLLTAREHLTLYAKIKGIKAEYVSKVVAGKIHEMGLTEYADRIAGTYSGGNKRKLSVAMAMIGEPSIVFLDEPSTGMDPVARRFMWEVISDIVTKREKCSVILTTHSMEECEALCTRIGIMVGGLLKCLGSSQHLRERYGLGYQMELGFEIPDGEDVIAFASSIIQAIGKSGGEFDNDITLTRDEVQRAFENLGYSQWWSRVTPEGAGADINASLLDNHCVNLKHLSSWCILENRYDMLLSFLHKYFNNYKLRERQTTKIRVEIPFLSPSGERRRLASMFGLMEKSKSSLRIREYSISQTSLEQIFNSFASKQEEETAHAHGLM